MPHASVDTMFVRKVEPRAIHWRGFAWDRGAFDSAERPFTATAEGTIRAPHHVVLVTLSGGAERLDVTSACGHRYSGGDRRGAVSFVPAHCERRLTISRVRSRWASISLHPALLDQAVDDSGAPSRPIEIPAFTNMDDSFISALVGECDRLYAADGRLDRTYCEAMSAGLAHYIARRYGRVPLPRRDRGALPAWRLRRIAEYLDAHDGSGIRIADLAGLVGLSPGHLHRAFRSTTGTTPLSFINERRIRQAMRILASEDVPITELAARVGFESPSHFTRLFRRIAGMNPSAYRREARR